MPNITVDLIRKKAEHHDGLLADLEEISLHQLDLEAITCIGNVCRRLKILYLQNNLIRRIEGVHKLKDLDYLNLAVNSVTVIEGLEHCEFLRKLDFTVNFIDVHTLMRSLRNLETLEHLRELYLTGNPCTTWPPYRELVVAVLPQLTKLDGTDVSKSERLRAAANAEANLAALRDAAAERRARDDEKSKAGDDDDEAALYEYTPETRQRMYDKERAKEAAEKAETDAATKFKEPVDLWKQSQQKLNEKVDAQAVERDGKLPSQRNVGRYDFTIDHDDGYGNVVVDIAAPRFLDTSEIDVDIHPRWLQVRIRNNLLLLHTPADVLSDKARVQRVITTGHLLLTMPRADGGDAVTRAAAAAAAGGDGGGENVVNIGGRVVSSSRAAAKEMFRPATTGNVALGRASMRGIVKKKTGDDDDDNDGKATAAAAAAAKEKRHAGISVVGGDDGVGDASVGETVSTASSFQSVRADGNALREVSSKASQKLQRQRDAAAATAQVAADEKRVKEAATAAEAARLANEERLRQRDAGVRAEDYDFDIDDVPDLE
jgi:protein TilB